MTSKPRIPNSYKSFNDYMEITCTYLETGTPSNAERLGIAPELTEQWKDIKTTWDPAYNTYNDKMNGRTTGVINQLKAVISTCKQFDKSHHFLNKISSSDGVTLKDLEVFNIKSGTQLAAKPSTKDTPIVELVVPEFKPRGGGMIYIKCGNSESTRKAIVPNAAVVEYKYCIGEEAPTNIEDPKLQTGFSTKATFTLELGAPSSSHKLFIFFRWNNLKHPKNAGPWSNLFTSIIL